MRKLMTLLVFAGFLQASAQKAFTRKDSLHGGLRKERTSYDVQRYDLDLRINPDEKSISGLNTITFKLLEPSSRIQVDLFENMKIDSIVLDRKKLTYSREFNAVFINIPTNTATATEQKLNFYYSGKPTAARNAPWDGGFDWRKDNTGKHWVGVAVQGTGASLWYPCKDSQTDEPENGASIKVAVPNGLMNVSNGRFTGSTDLKNGYTRWDWELKNPINNYNITVNIGDYVYIHDNYKGLDLDYYVLRYNEEKARKHFEVVKPMMDCFQAKFGQYPFADDSYKLVETAYLGMEHQSAVAYGNKYQNGYLGMDTSRSGVGAKFDYIIIHESAHEWFGNSITSKDIADMWIHEGFTTYAETVFVECIYGYDQAMRFINGQKANIGNDKPIIGHYGVNNEGSGDMYFKGSLMINTLRHIVNDDAKWWGILLKYANTYRHKIIDTEEVIRFFSAEIGTDLTPIFNQYLRTTRWPALQLTKENNSFTYRWNNTAPEFRMPVDVEINGKTTRLMVTAAIQKYDLKNASSADIKVKTDHFLITVE
ncbi:MAG TPA: M1 family metallopeptidase [Flavobacterium sp.]|jgi:aminopeptidase N